MANNPVVNSITFTGNVAEQATIQAQGIAGGLTFLLPNTAPIQGQLLDVSAISGNNVFLGWASAQSLSNIPLTALSTSGALSGDVIQFNGSTWAVSAFVPGSGTVTSVAVTVPAWLAVSGSPITGAGTIAITSAPSLTANFVLATPNGSSGVLSPRALVAADIPALPYLPNSTVIPANRPAASHNFLTAYDNTTGLFSIAQPSVTDVSGAAPLASPTFTGIVTAPAIANSGNISVLANGATTNSPFGLELADNSTNPVIIKQKGSGGMDIGAAGGNILILAAAGATTVQASTTLTLTAPQNQTVLNTAPSNGDNSSAVATTSYVQAQGYAPLASPTFTGTVTAPTISGVSQISAVHPGGLDITATTDLIQIQTSNGNTINVHGDNTNGVELINNTAGSQITLPDSGTINISSGGIQPVQINGDVNINDSLFVTGNGNGEPIARFTQGTGGSNPGQQSVDIDVDGNLRLYYGLKDNGNSLGTSGQVLTAGTGGQVVWSTNISGNAANVTGIVGLANGGTHADLSATGGTNFVLRQSSVGADITVSQLAAADLSNGVTGSGAVVLANAPTFTGTVTTAAISATSVSASTFVAVTGNLDLSSGSGHIVQNTDIAGSITITNPATSGSFSFVGTYAAPPVAYVTPTSDPSVAGIVAYWVTTTTGAITIHINTTPGTSITFNYLTLGN
jgi:hypothetical protein